MKSKSSSRLPIERKTKPETKNVKKYELNPNQANPVAAPAPSMDSRKPIACGAAAVEKFLVSTDTNGGD